VAAKSTSDDTICHCRSCASFRSCRRQRQKIEPQLWSSLGEASDTKKESLRSDAKAIESVPSPVTLSGNTDYEIVDVRRRERCWILRSDLSDHISVSVDDFSSFYSLITATKRGSLNYYSYSRYM
jgi:hypothetical protein